MLKRKRLDDSDEDDEPYLGKQVLPIANLPENFNKEPLDGMQYLFTVRRDARQLPHVTRVPNPYEGSLPLASSSGRAAPDGTNDSRLPSEEWRITFEKHFRNLRINIAQPTIHVSNDQPTPKKVMPDKRQRDFWWAFLQGKPEAEWNPPVKPKSVGRLRGRAHGRMRAFSGDSGSEAEAEEQTGPAQETWQINDEGEVELALRIDPRDSLPTPSGTPAPSTSDGFRQSDDSKAKEAEITLHPPEPTPKLIRLIDHRMALHLLMYFAHWINSYVDNRGPYLSESCARWIFALLTKVEDYISADDMSLLRNLARANLSLIKKERKLHRLGEDQDKGEGRMCERACWMTVCIVAGIWGQRDLWEDAAGILGT